MDSDQEASKIILLVLGAYFVSVTAGQGGCGGGGCLCVFLWDIAIGLLW